MRHGVCVRRHRRANRHHTCHQAIAATARPTRHHLGRHVQWLGVFGLGQAARWLPQRGALGKFARCQRGFFAGQIWRAIVCARPQSLYLLGRHGFYGHDAAHHPLATRQGLGHRGVATICDGAHPRRFHHPIQTPYRTHRPRLRLCAHRD